MADERESAPTPPTGSTVAWSPAEVPTQIGPYKILEQIGEGGMGVVYLAEQQEPVRRRVALKLIKIGMDTKQVIARFEAERQALAMMDHANVAKVFDAGATDAGRPYFVMEYVAGVPITEHCDRQRLSIDKRLVLFMQVCGAVQHAHQKGVIHRDIKPSNILVSADGAPKVIDFGVAKALHQKLTERTVFTEQGQLIGTPEYMSPEQAEMTGQGVDTRSDVYSLGVLLYELLTGTPPFSSESLRAAGVAEIQRIIREEDPPKPSTRLSSLDDASTTHARSRRADPRTLTRSLRGDLDWIVMKAIEKDRSRRYETANSLAEDLQRHLSHEPVHAGPPSAQYRIGKFVRRNRFGVTAAITILFVLLAGIVGTGLALVRALDAEELAETRRVGAVEAQEAAERQREAADRARYQAQRERDAAEFQAYVANVVAADVAMRAGEVATAKRRLAMAPEAHRNWEWYRLLRLIDRSKTTLRGHESGVTGVAFSPDGSRLASGSYDQTIKLWDSGTGEEIATLRGHEGDVSGVLFSPDGTRLASSSYDKTIRLWDAATGAEVATLRGHERFVYSVAFSPDGTRLASGSGDGTIKLWDAASGEEVATLRGHDSFEVRGEAQYGSVLSVRFSPDGSRLASGSYDQTIKFWDAASGEEVATLRGHEDGVSSVAFSPDGSRLASGSYDQTIKLWDTASGEEVATLSGHESGVTGVAFSRDGTRLASSSYDKTIKLWDAGSGEEVSTLRGHERDVSGVAFSPDGSRLASGSGDRTIKLWDSGTGEEIATLRGHETGVTGVLFSPDGTRLASSSYDKTIKLWDAATGAEVARLRGHEYQALRVAFSPDGTRLASGSWDGTIKLWDAASGEEMATLRGHERTVTSVAFSPDGTCLASGSETMKLWDVASGEEVASLRGHDGWVLSVAFSPDGTGLASGSEDGTIKFWDAASGEEVATLQGHEGRVTSLAFSPDGSRLASGSRDKTIKLWDAASGEEIATLRGHELSVRSVAFSPDGTRLASGSLDTTIKLWDTASCEEVATLRGHERFVYSVAFSPDGTRLASGSTDETIKIWDTIPAARRYTERAAYLRARSLMTPIVDRAFSELGETRAIAEAIRRDSSLSNVQRNAALNLVLERSVPRWYERNQREYLESLRQAVEHPEASAADLNAYAWDLLTIEPAVLRDPPAALPFALRACDLTDYEAPPILDTLALAYHLTGDHAKAVEIQKKAIALLPPGGRIEYEVHLEQFEAALAEE